MLNAATTGMTLAERTKLGNAAIARGEARPSYSPGSFGAIRRGDAKLKAEAEKKFKENKKAEEQTATHTGRCVELLEDFVGSMVDD